MEYAFIPGLDKKVSRLCLGGAVLGGSVSKYAANRVLDKFAETCNFIDTSDYYSEWIPGNIGGESESIIGNWMQGKNNRDKMVVTTKFGLTKYFELEHKSIIKSAEQSLKRLKTDYIDIYMTHFEIPPNKMELVISAFIELYKQGKIKSIGVSHNSLNSIKSLVDSINSLTDLKVSAVQDNFNPIERKAQQDLIPYLHENNIAFIGARGLAGGFLNGYYKNLKYSELYKIRGILRHARTAGPKVIYPTYRATLPAGAAFTYLSRNYNSLYSYLILLAKKYQCSMPTIVFSFLMQFEFLTSSIIGINRKKDILSFYTVPLNDNEIKLIETKANQ